MGLEIAKERFDDEDRTRFRARVEEQLEALRVLEARPGFGVGEATIGAELELNLVGPDARPLRENKAILAATGDPHVTLEIDRHNLEVNSDPVPLAGLPFSTLAAQIDRVVGAIGRAAAERGGRVLAVGILPTLERDDLGPHAMTDARRYRALQHELARLRGEDFRIEIDGEDPLALTVDDIALEGANTSFQLHLRVPPEAFARTYNAAQLATAPALAVGTNSPFFLGHRLWEETRVALFRQSVDDRASAASDDWRPARVSFGHGWVRRGVVELFAETVAMHTPLLPITGDEPSLAIARAGGVPELRELRLFNGTLWRWNRPVYDHESGGHVRIELRALPAGPTTIDTIATAAFLLGLTLGIAPEADRVVERITYGHARRSFYQAARLGMHAELLWPSMISPSPRVVAARELLPELLPVARRGLVENGVESAEADRWLGVIEGRVRTGVTGATWQRRAIEGDARSLDARRAMLERYLAHAATGTPVHTW